MTEIKIGTYHENHEYHEYHTNITKILNANVSAKFDDIQERLYANGRDS